MRFLHLQSSFHPGGKELRAARIINALGRSIAHTIVSAEPDSLGAAEAIDRSIAIDLPRDFPPLAGRQTPRRLQHLARAMAGFDLVLTYNWGAMDAAMAHTVHAKAMGLPPLVHHEDGFNQDEAAKLKWSRTWYRRIGLGRASAVVVPSRRLEAIAREVWQQPAGKVVRIANGIDTAAFGRKPKRDALPRVIKRRGELWLGTLAGLRPIKNLPRLVRAFAAMPDEWQLVILGEGPEREAIRAEAMRLEVAHRVHLPGFAPDPARAVGLFDLFALSSESEQFPISVVEAMAAGLAVVAPAVGDIAEMVAAENAPFVVEPGDEPALAKALLRLAGKPDLRRRIGEANRARARSDYDQAAMFAAYRATYARAMGRDTLP